MLQKEVKQDMKDWEFWGEIIILNRVDSLRRCLLRRLVESQTCRANDSAVQAGATARSKP